jgi:hypothetical protein
MTLSLWGSRQSRMRQNSSSIASSHSPLGILTVINHFPLVRLIVNWRSSSLGDGSSTTPFVRFMVRETFGVRKIAAIVTFATLGCAPKAPEPPAPRSATPVSASFDKTWSAVIDAFAARNIPIRTIERASGFIATEQLAVPIQLGGKPHPWADCGKAAIGGYFPPTNATYNVRVKGTNVSSTVQITVAWRYQPPLRMTISGQGTNCTTKGVWESEAESDVKLRAEGK